MSDWNYLANLKPSRTGYHRNQFSRTHLLVFIVIFGALGAIIWHSFATNPLPGASLATCSPSPCTNSGSWGTSYNVSVPDSAGAGALTVTRSFSIFKPGNLTGSAPLVVDLGGTQSNFFQLAADNRFVAILLPNNYHGGQYAVPTIQSAAQPDPNAYGSQDCGSSGTSQCDDIPWLKAAIDSVMCSGAPPCLNVDTSRVYVLGGSKGGAFTEGAVCDTRTYNYFTAAMVVSNNLISSNYSGSQSAAGNCPAILGTSDGFGGAAGLTPNKNLSIGWIYGTNDTTACAAAPASTCLDTGYLDAKNRWQFSDNQLAGDSSPPSPGTAGGSLVGFGHALGCQSTPSTDTTYGTTSKLRKRIYTGCAVAGRATQTIRVASGGHSFPGLDGVDGFDGETEAWNFFAAYGGPSSSASSLPGDLNNDGRVDGADLAFLASVWKTNTPAADLNNDNIVNGADLSIILSHYGQSGGGTSSYDQAVSYSASASRPAFSCTRTVNVTSAAQLTSALNNLLAGDCVINTQTGGFAISGEVTIAKNLSSYAYIDLKTGSNAVRFTGGGTQTPSSDLPSVYIHDSSNIKIYGGDITNNRILLYNPTSNLTWWNFYAHDLAGDGVDLFPAISAGGDINNVDIQGEVNHWGINCAVLDPHAEKCTGIHGINVADASNGHVSNSRIAIYAHDSASGAGMEMGIGSTSAGSINNTVYMKCVNLTMHAVSQVAGNCVMLWGVNNTGNHFKYIEATNLQGRPYDTNGISSGQSLSTDVVEYGIASNTNLNLQMNESIPQNMRWDTRGGTVFQNVSPLP